MSFQQVYHILSDLHLEFYEDVSILQNLFDKYPSLQTNTTTQDVILILAGDIGSPLQENYWYFLEDCATKYKHVIFIPGNHEYYNADENQDKYTIDEINQIIENRPKPTNVHFLNKSSIILEGIRYVGCTLWSNINKQNGAVIKYIVNDYNRIFESTNHKLTIETQTKMHQEHCDWLRQNINNANPLAEYSTHRGRLLCDMPCVVITHHLPTFRLNHPKYQRHTILSSAFCSALEGQGIFSPKIKLWICGHTHTPFEYLQENTGTQFVVNPLGYPHENGQPIIRRIEIEY